MFKAAKITKNTDLDKYIYILYSDYGIRFDARSLFLYQICEWREKVFIFGVDNSFSVQDDNRKKIS